MKKRVKFLMSIAGTGDPSPASMKRKYDNMTRDLTRSAQAAAAQGKQGKSPEEIEMLVEAEKKRDARIPRLSGFDHEFSFKPNDVALVPAEIAAKWQDAGICVIEDESIGAKK